MGLEPNPGGFYNATTTTPNPWEGYFVLSNCPTSYCIPSKPVTNWSLTMACDKWYLIGSVLCKPCPCCCPEPEVGIPWEEPCVTLDGGTIPLGSIIGPFEYNSSTGSYNLATVIKPFKGYLVYLDCPPRGPASHSKNAVLRQSNTYRREVSRRV